MLTRRFGRTGHLSSVAIFGGFAFANEPQADADAALAQVMAAGVNHIDVAPSYGDAELRLGPWLAQNRSRVFLGCKTMERSRAGATAELRRSFERLQTGTYDLYQFHAVTSLDELDQVTAPGGALEAGIEARDQGLTRYLGITGHGMQAPAVFIEALRRFDFDSVLFPVNFVMYADPDYRRSAAELLRICQARDVGVMAIKAIARAPWGERAPGYDTWYEPFDDPQLIQQGVDFALSQDGVTGLCNSGDITILPHFVHACEQFTPMSAHDQEALIATAANYVNIFGPTQTWPQ